MYCLGGDSFNWVCGQFCGFKLEEGGDGVNGEQTPWFWDFGVGGCLPFSPTCIYINGVKLLLVKRV